MREQLESERRRGEAELRGEMRKEMDKLREEVAEVQVVVENDDGDRHLHMNTFVRSSLSSLTESEWGGGQEKEMVIWNG